MFTSRVEYRLILREDNADTRLVPVGHKIGLVNDEIYKKTFDKQTRIQNEIERLKARHIDKILKRPGVSYEEAVPDSERTPIISKESKVVEIEIKYEGFITRQLKEIQRLSKVERIKIPQDMDYKSINSLSMEIREKLSKARPVNLGQASRISGVTPVAISILMIYLDAKRRSGNP